MNYTWLLALASLTGTVANVYKKRWCFAVWIVCNAAWVIIDLRAGIPAQACLMAVYFGLAIWGWVRWGDKRCAS